MRNSLVLLSAALLAVLAGRGEAAPSHATAVNSGDRVSGAIESASDRDLFRIEAPDGARLEVVAKAPRKSGLLPDLGLLDPSGGSVDLKRFVTGLTTSVVSIPVYGVHETGTWTVAVSGYAGTTGAYQLVVKVVADPKVRTSLTIPPGETVRAHFVGVTGARVDYTLVEKEGPGLDTARIRCPADQVIPGTTAVRSGTRLQARKIVLDRGGGIYCIEIVNSSLGPTTVDVTTVVRFPKVKTKKLSLGAEPRPSALSPTTGRNGTPFVLTGTGFQEGARVVFGDSAEAAGVQWISAAEIRGTAPECEASRLGETTEVSVLNPDGQYGPAPSRFTFTGIPGPASFYPKLSPLEGGVAVSVSGIRFREGYGVEVDGIPSPSVTVLSPTHLTFLTPAAPAGNYGVVVRDEFGRPAAPLPGLWYSDAPDVTSADPSEMSSLGGMTVNLEGDGLVDGVRVFVGGNEGVIQSQDPPTSLSFLCPPAKAGPVELEVRDPLGRSFKGDLLTMTRALHDGSAEALPPGPDGADFRGDIVTLGDTTGDGRPEILVTSYARWKNPGNGQFMPGSFLLENRGDGTFTDATSGSLPGFNLPGDDGQGDAAILGDMDGDGAADAVLVRSVPLPDSPAFVTYGNYKAYYEITFPTSFDPATASATRFLRNDGTGRLADRTDSLAPKRESTPAFGKGERWQGRAAALGDLDGDGDADLVLVSGDGVDRGTVGKVQWTYRYRYYYGYKYKYRDTAFLGQKVAATGALRVLENDGSGAFTHATADDPAPATLGDGTVLDDFRGVAAALGDLNGDGVPDLVVLGAGPSLRDDGQGGVKKAAALRVLFNDGSGGFTFAPNSVPEPLGTATPESDDWWQGCTVSLGDFDGDGDLDVAVGREGIRTWVDSAAKTRVFPALRLFRNQGGTAFTEDTEGFLTADLTTMPTSKTLLGVKSMCAADIDGDGDTDLVVTGRVTMPGESAIPGGSRMSTRILLNRGGSGLVDATADWLTAGDWLPSDGLAVGDIDGDGVPDLALVFNGDFGSGRRSLRILFTR